jgi:ribonuclease P protein component
VASSQASLRLGPSGRLRSKGEIARCRDRGSKIYCKHFLLLVLPSPTSESRLAVAVTTKLEKRAVGRNLIKRRIREIFRQNRSFFVSPYDILVVARRGVQECTFEDYQRELLGALRAHKIIQ